MTCPKCGAAPKASGQSYCRECWNEYRRNRYRTNGGRAEALRLSKRPGATFSRYKTGAKKRGFAFCLTLDDVAGLSAAPCHWCGCGGGGIDRIDSKGDYTEGNCVPCCGACNVMKGAMPAAEWLAKCAVLAERWEGKTPTTGVVVPNIRPQMSLLLAQHGGPDGGATTPDASQEPEP